MRPDNRKRAGNFARLPPRPRSVAPFSEMRLRVVFRMRTSSRDALPRPRTEVIFSPNSGDARRWTIGETPAQPPAFHRAISRRTSSPKAVAYWESGPCS